MGIQHYTESQKRAKELIKSGGNILLTGKPGTGKTELIKAVCRELRENGKKILITASTGLATLNLDGAMTIHSALKWNPRKKDYNLDICVSILKEVDVLVIDEISMLGTDIINHLANCLKHLEREPQLILSGDFFQLPPVTRTGQIKKYPFENKNWESFSLIPCVLQEIVRQDDTEFKKMLEKAMMGEESCIAYFNKYTKKEKIEEAITLCTTNAYADEINRNRMASINEKELLCYARGNIDSVDFDKTRVEKCLVVKKGMRIMTLRNDSSGRYQNGSLGTVLDIGEDVIKVKFDSGLMVDIKRVVYSLEAKGEPAKEIKIEQFPLRGGYAISIHKSQGQTFDAINLKAPKCWEPGQLYVALSRARSIKGIHLINALTIQSLKTDPKVIEFYKNLLFVKTLSSDNCTSKESIYCS